LFHAAEKRKFVTYIFNRNMSSIDKEQVEKELLPFLEKTSRPDLRCIGMEYFLGLTGAPEGKLFIISNNQILCAIIELVTDTQSAIAKDALFALVNLTQDENTVVKLLRLEKVDLTMTCLEYILDKTSPHADIACSLLANITRFEKGAQIVADLIMAKQDVIGLDKLVSAMCLKDYNPSNRLHYIAAVLSNLTQIPSTRQFIMDKDRCVIQRLLPFTEFTESTIRRHGIIGTLRNCCFDTEYHEWLLSEKVDILPRLLLPLAGPEEFDDEDNGKLPEDLQYLEPTKEREPDPEIRKMLIEAINQLCATKPGRLYVKEKNAYVIMRELHKWEKDKSVMFALENLVDILIGDEPEKGMENLKEIHIPEDLKQKFDKMDDALIQDEKTIEAKTQ
ncbi:unnamed protein product, partial [Owenia fusiformis]